MSSKALYFTGTQRVANCAWFALLNLGMYLLDGKDAVHYDIQVIKGQLAFLGYVLSDRTRTAISPFRDYATVLGDDVPEAAAGRRSLFLVETMDDLPSKHYAVSLRGGVKNKNAKPYRWLDSLRAQPATYWTYDEFLAAEAPNYKVVKGVFEM
eukprot:gene19177-22925_t